ncbi:MAG: hypothetical protein ACFFBD_23385, partial [Candidatus Hodarchaeota archaeon]
MTGIVYGVSPPDSTFVLYVMTSRKYKKTKNIKNSPAISFVIPFPHYILRFVPSSCIQFQGTAEIVSFDSPDIHGVFQQKRILRLALNQSKTQGSSD